MQNAGESLDDVFAQGLCVMFLGIVHGDRGLAGKHQHAHHLIKVLAAKVPTVEEHVANGHDDVQFRVAGHLRLLERVNQVLHEQGNLVAEVRAVICGEVAHAGQAGLEGEGLVVLGQGVLDVLPEVVD